MIPYSFNELKALNALLYISNNIAKSSVADKYATLKILYFAEKKHLAAYGRLITDDRFAALKFGPVPSKSYDILDNELAFGKYFRIISKSKIQPLLSADANHLSESDIECLGEAIKENKELDFVELMNKSHDAPYNEAFSQSIQYMSVESIAKDAGADDKMIGFINERYSTLNLLKWLPA